MSYEPLMLKNVRLPNVTSLETYMKGGGYEGLSKAMAMAPPDVTKLVQEAGLRGRGGAGFPTGQKWSFLPNDGRERYLICNADESEPGTFKDRWLMEGDPHQLLEGMIIGSYAIQAKRAFIYIRGEFGRAARILNRALDEARAKGILGPKVMGKDYALDILVHRGAGAYECGEETALIESLEGKRGVPRVKPPFPAVVGLYGKPTIVNNVETLCNVPHILARGAAWYKSLGTEKSPGPKVYSISGDVNRPGVYEGPMGTPLIQIIEEWAGGMVPGQKLKAVWPGGAATPVLTAEEASKVTMDFEGPRTFGSMMGSPGTMVLGDKRCVVGAAARLTAFFEEESCGHCVPCREGSRWLAMLADRVEAGQADGGTLDLLRIIPPRIAGHTHCPFGDFEVIPVTSTMAKFKDEWDEHIRLKGCPYPLALSRGHKFIAGARNA